MANHLDKLAKKLIEKAYKPKPGSNSNKDIILEKTSNSTVTNVKKEEKE
jgi:hypothetical protein